MSWLPALLDPYGTSPGSSLSWSQHHALTSTAKSSAASARASVAAAAAATANAYETQRVRLAIEDLRLDVGDVAEAVGSMERNLGLLLADQAGLLTRQVGLLTQIAETLRTPARTRAAERIADAGELLRHGRHERALRSAEQAIEDDPNNPAAFTAAGWAAFGLSRHREARDFFREAAQASHGDDRQRALRQAARLTFVVDGPQAALTELPVADKSLSGAEQAATTYDHVVYHVAAGEPGTAANRMHDLAMFDRRFCLMALTDPVISSDETVMSAAVEQTKVLDAWAERLRQSYRDVESQYAQLCAELEAHELTDTPGVRKLTAAWQAEWRRLINDRDEKLKFAGFRQLQREETADTANRALESHRERLRPFISNELQREEALQGALETLLQRKKRNLVLQRGRTSAHVGRKDLVGRIRAWRLNVNPDGSVVVSELDAGSASKYYNFYAARK